jgi:hypothetical protein
MTAGLVAQAETSESVAAPTLEYAPLFTLPSAHRAGVWREGAMLVMYRDALLPDVCVCCGKASTLQRMPIRVAWLPAWLRYRGSIFAIVSGLLLRRRTVLLRIALCAEDRSRRVQAIRRAFLLGIVMLELVWLAAQRAWFNGFLFGAACVGVVASLVEIHGAPTLALTYIDRRIIRLSGVPAAFLHQLPIGGPPGVGEMP